MKLAIIGSGYVGLPLAIEFSKYFNVTCFDINKDRIQELKKGSIKISNIKKVKF